MVLRLQHSRKGVQNLLNICLTVDWLEIFRVNVQNVMLEIVTLKKDGISSHTGEPELFWKCHICRRKIAVHKGSFFSGSKLSLSPIYQIMHSFAMNGKQEYYHLFMADVSRPTLIDWYNFCRDVCLEILLADNRKIGGQGHIVEIDESQSRKNKYHKGRLVDGVGVFRGIDRTTRETFFKTVED